MYSTLEKVKMILKDLEQYRYTKRIRINTIQEEKDDKWLDYVHGQRWGGHDIYQKFRGEIIIPPEWENQRVLLQITTGQTGKWHPSNPQMVLYINGDLIQGVDGNHSEILLKESAKGDEKIEFLLDAYSGTGNAQPELSMYILTVDENTEKLYYDIKVPYEVANLLSSEDKRSIDISDYLNKTVDMLDLRRVPSKEYNESVKNALQYIEEAFYSDYCKGHTPEAEVICIGHTHIDVAYLWNIAQTRQKTVRSYSTVLNLMRQYPDYLFMSSQPQLYQFLKEEKPHLFEEIKKMAKQGRWETEGGMWLEADCNLVSGESLVRQFLYGKAFFKDEFGVDSKLLWLPDVFGYNAAMPQILKKSGIDYFITSKISWNDYNKMPYDTFMWKGLDGTEILSYFITTQDYTSSKSAYQTTYNGNLSANQIMGAWKRFQQKNLTNKVLVCYGFGDGGGGPTTEMLENSKRLDRAIPGCPKTSKGTVLEFMKDLESKTANNNKLPKWTGELYLECHRGTYTSMGRNKKYNRRSEIMYQDIEFLSSVNMVMFDNQYPQDILDNSWKKILLNQFHDILPGSSIGEVFHDSDIDYKEVLSTGQNIIEKTLKDIAEQINTEEKSLILFNSLYFEREDIAEISLEEKNKSIVVFDEKGEKLPSQINGDKLLVHVKDIPSKGYKTFQIKEGNNKDECQMNVSENRLENKFFDIKFDNGGNIISLYDKRERRELIKKGERANLIQAFEDKPSHHDAWEISLYYQDKMYLIDKAQSIEVIEKGPVRAVIRIKRTFLQSTITQDICIYNDIDRIDFKTEIDWKEEQILLKTAFPLDIHADKASYDIQFGNIERPTHQNTSWDYARFEVCAHKWADISEEGYGVSLINDCKYGYDIKDGTMRLTLLKSGIYPFKNADKEVHSFAYSLYPHKEGWKKASTDKKASCFNSPLYALIKEKQKGILPCEFSFISCDCENVVIDTVKKAQNNNDIIIRVFENHNKRSFATLNFAKKIYSAYECDLMENTLKELDFSENNIDFEIKPYEIRTFRLKFKD